MKTSHSVSETTAPPVSENRVLSRWQGGARAYVRISGSIGFYGEAARLLAAMVPRNASRILDLACGDGRFTRHLIAAAKGQPLEVALVDAAADMLASTADVTGPNLVVRRWQDDQRLRNIPADLVGRLDVVGIASALHLLRDAAPAAQPSIDLVLGRCREVLAPGGEVVVNLPDQAFDFGDGVASRFHAHARRLVPDTPDRAAVTRFDAASLASSAARSGFTCEIESRTLELTWSDFLNFYAISATGADRLAGGAGEARLAEVAGGKPWFESEPYRWAFIRFRRAD